MTTDEKQALLGDSAGLESLEGLAGRIAKMFEKMNDARCGQLSEIKAIQERVYNTGSSSNNDWASNLELPDLWEQCQTMKAHVIDVLYSHPEGLFDVYAQNSDNEEFALKQKAMLVCAFEEMNLREQIERIVNNIVETGECTLFVGWENRQKAVRRWDENSKGYNVSHKTIYDGATVKTIAAQDFVFDIARADNWESCPKIYRTQVDLEELKDSPHNDLLTKEIENALSVGVLNSKEGVNGFKNGMVEILEYWGDITLENGVVLKNQLIVVAGRRFVIRFEENPYISSPFIYANLIENPTTKRGISPLKPILSLNSVATNILNKQLDAYSLIVNPPYLAPKGAFKGGQVVAPGKIIEYDASLLPQTPTPLNFSPALVGWDFIQYFKGCMEASTGIYRTMGGQIAGNARTATELMQSANGQSARINLIIDSINRKLILPMVQKVGDTIANFMCETRTIRALTGENTTDFEIDDEIRCCEYVYRYSDRKASYERKWRQKELAETVLAFSKIPEFSGKINWNECFKYTLEHLGVENSDKFLVPEGIERKNELGA